MTLRNLAGADPFRLATPDGMIYDEGWAGTYIPQKFLKDINAFIPIPYSLMDLGVRSKHSLQVNNICQF